MLKNFYILLIVLLMLPSTFNAQKEESNLPRHGLGLNACISSGGGFSYRFVAKKIGFQASFIPVYSRNEKLYLIQGLSFNYNLKSENKFDVFTYIGSGLVYSKEEEFYSYVETVVNDSPIWADGHTIYKRYLFSAGGGIGINIKGANSIDWVVRFGGVYYSNFFGKYGFIPSLGAGAYYSF